MRRGASLLHPAWLMIVFWTVLYAIYFVAPINQTPSISAAGTVFIASHILVFCIGSVLGSGGIGADIVAQGPATSPDAPISRTPRAINVFFLIGIFGALLSILGKVLSLDFFSLLGSAELRAERAQQLLDAVQLSSSGWSAVGFLTYPAGFVAIALTIVLYESLPRGSRVLLPIYVGLIFLLSFSTGGRSTIFVTMLFFTLAFYIRRCRGLSFFPRSRMIQLFIWSLLIGFVGYSTLIWQARNEISGQNIDEFLTHIEVNWGVTLSDSLGSSMLVLEQPGLTQNVISSVFYFTQSISIVERILEMSELPTLFGAYHIDLVAAAVRVFFDNPDFLGDGYAALLASNVYGFFTGAWGALYIDFGFMGSYVTALVWGSLAGVAHRNARKNIYLDGFTQYVFWMYSILVSFVSPPFGFSNSAVTFIWFVLYRFFVGPSQRNSRLAACPRSG